VPGRLSQTLLEWKALQEGFRAPSSNGTKSYFKREKSMQMRQNRQFIPNYGERYRNGELISSGFVESTVNQVVSKRMVKKQQMQMDAARSPSTVAGKSVVKFTHWALFAQEKS
jgi:hypothetical protein